MQLRKLRRMSPAECAGRVAALLQRRRDRARHRSGQRLAARRVGQWFQPEHFLRDVVGLVPGASAEQVQRLLDECPDCHRGMTEAAERNAERIVSDQWELLGHRLQLNSAIDWHQDPRTGYRWPAKFYGDLPLYNLPGETDVKYPWEMSRHQFTAELARAWRLGGNDQYAETSRRLILDWIEANPALEGVNWTSGLEVAIRSLSWIWTLALLSNWTGWTADDLGRVASSLEEHADYLERHFSFYSSPYNHLIGEATGLLWIGRAITSHPKASRWRRKATRVLRDHAPRQFYADGFCVEQAVGYHYFTLGFLALAHTALPIDEQQNKNWSRPVHQAFCTGLAFRGPDGRWPAIGDLDSARSIPVQPDDFWRFDSLCSLAAAMFEDSSLKMDAAEPGAEVYLLLGFGGVETWRNLEANKSSTVDAVLPDSGYAIARENDDWMLFDAGPIAHGLFPDATPSTAHGHADTLNVVYSSSSQVRLRDSGMPFYGGDPRWVRHFRSAEAHNCVVIEGAPFVQHAGRLAWSHEVGTPQLRAEFSSQQWLTFGKVTWPGASHSRYVLGLPGEAIWIADVIEVDDPRQVSWHWQLPRCEPAMLHCDDWGFNVELEGFALRSRSSDSGLTARLQVAAANDPAGWYCDGYGQRQDAATLVADQQTSGTLLVVTAVGNPARQVRFSADGRLLTSEQPQGAGEAADREIDFEGIRWMVGRSLAADSSAMTSDSATPGPSNQQKLQTNRNFDSSTDLPNPSRS